MAVPSCYYTVVVTPLSPGRRWVLQHLLQENSPPSVVNKEVGCQAFSEQLQGIVREEMSVCCEAAGRYPSNYNSWSHRIWVLQHLAKLNLKVFRK